MAKRRVLPIGRRTAQALERYVRSRAAHHDAGRPKLWLGHAGPMTPSGVFRVIRDRAHEAGLGDLHARQFRHTAADAWLRPDGNENHLMRLAYWSRAPGTVARR